MHNFHYLVLRWKVISISSQTLSKQSSLLFCRRGAHLIVFNTASKFCLSLWSTSLSLYPWASFPNVVWISRIWWGVAIQQVTYLMQPRLTVFSEVVFLIAANTPLTERNELILATSFSLDATFSCKYSLATLHTWDLNCWASGWDTEVGIATEVV